MAMCPRNAIVLIALLAPHLVCQVTAEGKQSALWEPTILPRCTVYLASLCVSNISGLTWFFGVGLSDERSYWLLLL